MESNGYIMLDFSMLDFSRHNQVIDGIYKRVFEIVGANKFVIILGADEKTPLPACVSFTNGSYVIESFLFNFAITADDNVRIENVSTDIIKDGIISAGTTWSSSKIKSELENLPTPSAINYIDVQKTLGVTNGICDITGLLDDNMIPLFVANNDNNEWAMYILFSFFTNGVRKWGAKCVNSGNWTNYSQYYVCKMRIYYCTIN